MERKVERARVHVRKGEDKILIETEEGGKSLSLLPHEAMSPGIELLRAAYSLRRLKNG